MIGYGIYWAIIEDLYNNANALRNDCDGIAYDLRVDSEVVKSVLNDFDLFVFDGDFFGSLSVERRLQERNLKSNRARESAISRWGKVKNNADASKKDANALQEQCKGNAIKEKKVKESKVKENKEGSAADAPHPLKPSPDYSVEQKESFKKFEQWILDNTPRVAKMKEPFTIAQYLSLAKKGFTFDRIRTTLADMHNWTPLLTKNQSAYLTLTKWTKKDQI